MHVQKLPLLSTHADRQGVDISVTVCLFVSVRLQISPPRIKLANGVKFFSAIYLRPKQGISHFCELCSPRSLK